MVSYFFASKINRWIVVYSPKSDPVLVKDQEELPKTPLLMKPFSEVAKNRAQKLAQTNRPLLLPPELLLSTN